MTEPTPTPASRADRNEAAGLPRGLVCFVTVPDSQDIFCLYDSGLVRHALPCEWTRRGDTLVVKGTAADTGHLQALAGAVRLQNAG